MRKTKHHLTLLILSFIIQACAIGPDYQRPELNLPNNYDSETNVKYIKQISNIENKPGIWWKSFNDPLLEQLINIASVDNLNILASLSKIEQAESLASAAFATIFPSPNLSGQYIKNKTAAARFPGITNRGIEFEIYSAAGSVSWELDLFGRIRRAYESASHQEAQVSFNSIDLVNSIQAQVATAYFQLRAAQLQKQIAINNFKTQDETFNIIQKKFDVGVLSAYELERARTQKLKTQSTILTFDSLINSSLNRLSTLTGKYPGELPQQIHEIKDIPDYVGPINIGKPFDLIRRRPDVRAAEEIAHSATADIGVSLGDLYPKVSFSGTLSRDARDISNLNTAAAQAFNYGPQISWSILNFNAILNKVDANKANAKSQLTLYKAAVVQALEDVENSLVNLNNTLEKVDILNQVVDASRKSESIAKLKYDVGNISLLDLLTSQAETLASESTSVQSKLELSLAYVNLFRYLGGAWEEEIPSSNS